MKTSGPLNPRGYHVSRDACAGSFRHSLAPLGRAFDSRRAIYELELQDIQKRIKAIIDAVENGLYDFYGDLAAILRVCSQAKQDQVTDQARGHLQRNNCQWLRGHAATFTEHFLWRDPNAGQRDHLTFNQRVGGSIPPGLTSDFNYLLVEPHFKLSA
jgi:hypothetical protein